MTKSFLNFEGKTVVVTGGKQGIGAAIVAQFATFGAKVVSADVGEQAAEANQFETMGHQVRFVQCDVSRETDIRQLVAYVESEFGGLEILVNNAGVFPRATLEEIDETFWNHLMDINLKGAFLMSKTAAPLMARNGGGSIVNIGSLHSTRGDVDTLVYAVSKGGIVTLTRNLAYSLAKYQIRVNCVHPGWVASDGELARLRAIGMDLDTIKQRASALPLGRMQTGEDVAGAVAFLASDLANQITGQTIAVDGGLGLR